MKTPKWTLEVHPLTTEQLDLARDIVRGWRGTLARRATCYRATFTNSLGLTGAKRRLAAAGIRTGDDGFVRNPVSQMGGSGPWPEGVKYKIGDTQRKVHAAIRAIDHAPNHLALHDAWTAARRLSDAANARGESLDAELYNDIGGSYVRRYGELGPTDEDIHTANMKRARDAEKEAKRAKRRRNPTVRAVSGDAARARVFPRLHKLRADLLAAGLNAHAATVQATLRNEHDYAFRPQALRTLEADGKRALADHRALLARLRTRANANPAPSMAKLVEAAGRYNHMPRVGVPLKRQRAIERTYLSELDRTLKKMGARVLSAENERALDSAASKWWNNRAMKGAGVDW